MAKTKKQKKNILDQYKEKISNAKGFVVLRTNGVTPSEAAHLRSTIAEFEASFNVVKNTLFKIALKESNLDEEESFDNLQHSILFLSEDVVGPSKALKAFINDTKPENKESAPKVQIISGYLDGQKLSQIQVQELAEMPTFEGSISMILGILDQAIGGVVNVLQNPVQGYVSIIDQAFKE